MRSLRGDMHRAAGALWGRASEAQRGEICFRDFFFALWVCVWFGVWSGVWAKLWSKLCLISRPVICCVVQTVLFFALYFFVWSKL